ncbi:gliding motility lipoprotein GldH [Sphingobacterium composti Ten et al. 2007 non Yoo et al. 2007]|uniref:gliding motility lipoprotein GldH n=1 Tax=Sphingobacterium composti TaxID=363260 RepID=UPI00135B60EC|nr:gliding motility lipoprotein GldH [Sphingobacterium composti Ten et al. 2007 non Yoo et al. 2007]
MKRFFTLLAIYCCASSCTTDAYFEENKEIANRSWNYNQIPSFDIKINDKTAKYDVFINLRHTNLYDFSNIYVLLHEKGNSLIDTAYRKEIKLAELDGKWTGKLSGSLYEIQYLAKSDFVFPDTGTYTFGLEQNMRVNPLLEVADVGIKIIKK